MDIGRAFNYPFRDPAWLKKILIGAVLFITIVGIPAVIGYTMRIMRAVVSGADTPMPEWDNVGELWVEGIKAIIVYIFWYSPVIILSIVTFGDNSLSIQCISWIVSSICSVLAAIAILGVATSGDIGAGFQIGRVIDRLTSNFGDYVIVFFMSYVLGIVAVVGVIACFIGVLATATYAGFVQSHLWAQAYRRSEGLGDLPPAQRF